MTAKIKLNAASGGGSVALEAPSSCSNNRVITLPDIADGTLLTSQSILDSTKLSPALSSDYVKLQQASQASGVSELIFDNLDVSTYRFFDLMAFLQPANDAVSLRFRYREGGSSGSNITGNSYSLGFNEKKDSNTSNCTAEGPTTKIILSGSIGNHASEGIGISMRISVGRSSDIANTKWLANFISWNAVYREQGNAARMTNGQGHLYDDTKYPTGFSFHFENGSINNYSYTLYGIKG